MESSEAAPLFPLLWTLGMSGHRRLPDEAAARAAVRTEIASLQAAATQMQARLVAVSSIALGADLIFAEECLAAGILWKCLLPFPKEEFRKDDFTDTDWDRVQQCMAKAYGVEILSADVPPNMQARNAAYLDCGHRTVEAADVMLLVWNGQPAAGTGGTGDMWDYARTLNKPVWHFNPENGAIRREGWPGVEGEWKDRQLFHSRITPLILEAERLPQTPAAHGGPIAPPTATGAGLLRLFARLDHIAKSRQGDTQNLMQKIVRAHLLATAAAALSATLITQGLAHSLHELPVLAVLAAVAFSVLVIAKPWLAGLALHWDRKLHHAKSQQHWVEARVAAELCRSALTCWTMPAAPLRVFDDEDFPHLKRLIRTLRIAREIDQGASITEDKAIEGYINARVDDQARYFHKKHGQSVTEYNGWQRKFDLATGFVIVVGIIVGLAEAVDVCCTACGVAVPHTASHLLHLIAPFIAFLLIVAPFYASYAMAMLSILDCRRRRERFATMKYFLERQRNRLLRVKSPSIRAEMVETTERMLLEELHEWHSVARDVRV